MMQHDLLYTLVAAALTKEADNPAGEDLDQYRLKTTLAGGNAAMALNTAASQGRSKASVVPNVGATPGPQWKAPEHAAIAAKYAPNPAGEDLDQYRLKTTLAKAPYVGATPGPQWKAPEHAAIAAKYAPNPKLGY